MNSQNKTLMSSTDLLKGIERGRKHLGETMPVAIYRLLEYTIRDAIAGRFGNEVCIELFREAAEMAGRVFYEMYLPDIKSISDLFSKWQAAFSTLKMGIVRVESLQESGDAVLTVSEDLDCSGLPVLGDAVCHYDEGFIEGIMMSYTGKKYRATEVDCWAKGDRVCRFEVKLEV